MRKNRILMMIQEIRKNETFFLLLFFGLSFYPMREIMHLISRTIAYIRTSCDC